VRGGVERSAALLRQLFSLSLNRDVAFSVYCLARECFLLACVAVHAFLCALPAISVCALPAACQNIGLLLHVPRQCVVQFSTCIPYCARRKCLPYGISLLG